MRIRCAARFFATAALAAIAALVAPAAAQTRNKAEPGKMASAPKAASKKADAKPAPAHAKAAPKKASPKGASHAGKGHTKHHYKPLPRKPGSKAGEPDEATRRIIAGTNGAAVAPGERRAESPELRAMRELDRALFPSSAPSAAPWPADTLPLDPDAPTVVATGVPPSGQLAPAAPAIAEAPHDLSWLRKLDMPDIPVRWDARVVRYLEFYRDNPRGRSMVAGWIKKSGRYGGMIRRILREQGLPEDILWLALVESGFDPTIESPAGAAGLWQFMPEGARIYGLTVDRWVDERLDPERSTVAAARYLADLRQRFGGWELAFAAYNMGYGGLLAAIRKYNTNDFWELSRFEAGVPYETSLYVPKIVAMAIVARNKKVFGCDDVELDPAVTFDEVNVGSGVSLRAVAVAAGATEDTIGDLNPQLLAKRTPPVDPGAKGGERWTVRVPPGAASRAAKNVPKLAEEDGKLERWVVRWGETVDDIAEARGTTRSVIASLNGIHHDEVLRPGTVLFVPATPGTGTAVAAEVVASAKTRPVVVVPPIDARAGDRRRVFYRVVNGDRLRDLAAVFGVTADELCHWNLLDPGASLHDGMTLQVFVPKERKLDGVHVLEDEDADVLVAGTPEFFRHFEAQKGRRRMEVVVKDGDTFRGIAKRYGLTTGMLERINQRSRSTPLSPGDKLVVYVPTSSPLAPSEPAPAEASDVAVADKSGRDDAAHDDDAPRAEPAGPDEVEPATLRTTPDADGAAPAKHPIAP